MIFAEILPPRDIALQPLNARETGADEKRSAARPTSRRGTRCGPMGGLDRHCPRHSSSSRDDMIPGSEPDHMTGTGR
jgi:hypothetical protein